MMPAAGEGLPHSDLDGAALRTEILGDLESLEVFRIRWEALAVALARPFCSPAWMLAWWRHLAPSRSRLRVVVVLDGDELLGVAPFFVQLGLGGLVHYRLLGSRTSYRLEPLARPGWEKAVAQIVVDAISTTGRGPHVLSFEGIPNTSPWPLLFLEAWPGGTPWTYRVRTLPAPTLSLRGRTFQQWMASKSSNFRKQARRRRRQLEEEGATFRVATTEKELARGLSSFATLHYARWRSRGGSRALDARVERMLADVARQLMEDQRMQVWCLELGGTIISAQVLLEAGGEVAWWLGGFDERWAKYNPTTQTILVAIEDAFARGGHRFDFGGGGQEYKYRFADGEDSLEWVQLVTRGRRYPLTRLQLAPAHRLWRAHSLLSRKLAHQAQQRVETLLGEAWTLLRRLTGRA